ncbi:MAG: hypothetical protein JXA33_24680 [Anaerolineae bacterium]|nr:hypothetical protein [Anaerolineae bacterium]
MALRTLYQTLLDSDLARLQVIAQQWGITLQAERRTDIAAELADAMARFEAVERALSAMPEVQRAALDDLLRHKGTMPWAIFIRRWGQLRPIGPGRLVREELWRDPASAAEGLWYWGVLQRAFIERDTIASEAIKYDMGAVEMAFVPTELQLYLPAPPPQEIPLPEPVAPPLHQTLGTSVLADDLVTFWSVLQFQLVPLDTEKTWSRAEFLEPGQQFHAPTTMYLELLQDLALEQHWIRVDESGILRPLPQPMLTWLSNDSWTQWGELAKAWMASRRWNDLAHVSSLRSDPIVGWANDPLSARQTFLKLLRHCIPGIWYDIANFVTYIYEYAPDFLRPDGNYDSWSPRDAMTDTALRGFEAWEMVEGALVVYYLTGPLVWLGFLDLGAASATVSAKSFRVNAAGAAFLDLEDPPTLPDAPPMRLLADGSFVVSSLRRYERFQLSRIAQFITWKAAAVTTEREYYYRLTPASLARARQQHITAERLITFLQEAIQHTLPEYLRNAITQTYNKGETPANLAHVWLLRVHDEHILEHPTLRPFIQEKLGSGIAIIRAEDREHIIATLTQEGILPDIDEV